MFRPLSCPEVVSLFFSDPSTRVDPVPEAELATINLIHVEHCPGRYYANFWKRLCQGLVVHNCLL